jgi:hypothetical protein
LWLAESRRTRIIHRGAYRSRARGYYDQPGNHVYDTPTILRDTVVSGNRVHRVKTWFADGGAIYHLSADPGAQTVIEQAGIEPGKQP